MRTLHSQYLFSLISIGLFASLAATGCQHHRNRKAEVAKEESSAPKAPSTPATPPSQAEQPTRPFVLLNPQQQATREMTRAFESLAFAESLSKEQVDKEENNEADLLSKAKDLYKEAQTRFDQGDYQGSVEFARASTDAGRGIQHMSRATAATDSDLKPPVTDPARQEMLSTLMEEINNKLTSVKMSVDQEGRAFQDEGKRLLDEADAALRRGDMMATRQLTAGADAFSRVVDHITQAKTAH